MPPRQTVLPRAVQKWLQSLRLSVNIKNIRRDFSNGCLVAEIFSHYFPRNFVAHTYVPESSLPVKQKNWSRLDRAFKRQKLRLTKDLIEGTINCKPGAAELLLLEVYVVLTNRRDAQRPDSDSSDEDLVPTVTCSPPSKIIRCSWKTARTVSLPDLNPNQKKGDKVRGCRHLEHKAAQRVLHPELGSSSTRSGAAASFKEIKVRQPVRHPLNKYESICL